MLNFLYWWLEQLSSLVPETLRRRWVHVPDATIIEIGSGSVIVKYRRRGRSELLGSFPPDAPELERLAGKMKEGQNRPRQVLLRLPAPWVLRKTLMLPAAARADLRRVLGYEMERETPFTSSELWWDYRVRQVDHQAGTIHVEMIIIPRQNVEPVLVQLHAAGIMPAAIEFGADREDGGEDRHLVPIGDGAENAVAPYHKRLRLAAAAILVLLVLSLPFIRQYWELAAADAELEQFRAQADEAASLRKAIDRSAQAAALIAVERRRIARPLEVLAAATRLLPDNTYLTEFDFTNNQVTLSGLSPAAAELVGAFAKAPPFKDPALAAPVVRSESGGLESFTIRVSFVPGAVP
jgi:general secretion pathway protein L